MSDHYAEAERLLEKSNTVDMDGGWAALVAAQAQVHATLATVQRGAFERAAFTDTRTVPWPPSNELVKRVATAIAEYADESDFDLSAVVTDVARAVLDAIGDEAVSSDE